MPRRGGGRRGADPNRDQPSSAMNQSGDPRGGSGGNAGVSVGSRGGSSSGRRGGSVSSTGVSFDSRGGSSSGQRGGRGSSAGKTAGSSGGSEVREPSQPVVVTASKEPPSAAALRSDPSSSRQRTSTDPAEIDLLTREVEKATLQPAPPPPVSSKALSLPRRPGYGTVGKKIVVRANHFLVEVSDKDIHHYDVSIKPEITSKKVCRAVIERLEDLYKESHLNNRMLAYDGRKSLYAAGALPFSSKEFVFELPDNRSETSTSTRKDRTIKVTINYASKPDVHHLQQFIRGRQLDVPQETIQMLDVVLRTAPSQKYTVVGRSFFSLNLGPKGELGDGVEYWKGYYQSLRPTQMGLSLNIDVSARSFYEQIRVTEFVAKYINLRDFSRPLSDQDRVKVKKVLRGIKVRITYSEHARTYKVTGISTQPISQLGFSLGDDTKKTSVLQYFRERYGIALKYVTLPALQAGNDSSNPIYLPMELCEIVGGQRYTKKLNERQVTALLRATCQRPPQRENSIKEMLQKNNYRDDNLINKEFEIKVREDLTPIDARVLPCPMLKYHDTGKETRVNPNMGQWNMINKKMVNGGKVEWWTCVNFSSRINRNLPFDFCQQLIEMCNSKGMDFNPNPLIPITSAQSSQIERTLGEVNKKSQERLKNINRDGDRLQLLIIILPDFSGSYGRIKRVCETELGIVSQCCQPKQAAKMNIQYFENVALKINVKVGGRNTVLNDAILRKIPFVSDMPTIVFGADVTHPTPGEDSSPSIAAVVASMDWPEVTKYKGLISSQSHREEIIQDLYKLVQDPQRGLVHGGMIKELLVSFYKSTGLKPHRIIFYRDGVSEGQFNQVLLYEMDAIRKACASLQEGYQPPVTFIVVQKRHHTRLFPADNRNLDRSGNILPGTVVDTKICHPTEFDFYLNSHAGIQGTSRPAHYHVLYDENKFTADSLQLLTNNLCYTYARCTRSVSIVPPAYYAHLAAFRARYYIEGEFSESGSTIEGRTGEVRPLPVVMDNVKEVMFYC